MYHWRLIKDCFIQEVDELVATLQEKLDVAPKKLENQTRDLEKKQSRYKTLQQNKPLK